MQQNTVTAHPGPAEEAAHTYDTKVRNVSDENASDLGSTDTLNGHSKDNTKARKDLLRNLKTSML